MRQNTRNLLIPIIGIILTAVLYIAVAFAYALDLETGSAAEWVGALGTITVGLVAAGFAALAWQASERATRAEERAADVAERALRKDVKISLNYSEQIPGLTAITIELAEGCPSIWIKDTNPYFIWYGDCTSDDLDQLRIGGSTIHGTELSPGESIYFAWLHPSNTNPLLDNLDSPGRIPHIGFLLSFSVTPRDHGQVFTQPLTLPETPRIQ